MTCCPPHHTSDMAYLALAPPGTATGPEMQKAKEIGRSSLAGALLAGYGS